MPQQPGSGWPAPGRSTAGPPPRPPFPRSPSDGSAREGRSGGEAARQSISELGGCAATNAPRPVAIASSRRARGSRGTGSRVRRGRRPRTTAPAQRPARPSPAQGQRHRGSGRAAGGPGAGSAVVERAAAAQVGPRNLDREAGGLKDSHRREPCEGAKPSVKVSANRTTRRSPASRAPPRSRLLR